MVSLGLLRGTCVGAGVHLSTCMHDYVICACVYMNCRVCMCLHVLVHTLSVCVHVHVYVLVKACMLSIATFLTVS